MRLSIEDGVATSLFGFKKASMRSTGKDFPQSSQMQSSGEFCAARAALSKAFTGVAPEPGAPLEPLLEARPDDSGGESALEDLVLLDAMAILATNVCDMEIYI